MNTAEVIERLKKELVECGIPIRATNSEGKWDAVDYLNLLPEQVQEQERWDNEGWEKILNQMSLVLGGTLLPPEENIMNSRHIIIVLLALLRHAEIIAKDPGKVEWNESD